MTTAAPETIGCPDAERELVGALLASTPDSARPILDRLADDDLTVEACRLVVAALRCLLEQSSPDLGPVAVLGELRRTGQLGCTAYGAGDGAAGVLLFNLYERAPVPLAAGHRLRIVLEHAARRRLQTAGLRLMQAAERHALDAVPELLTTESVAAMAALSRAGV